MYRNPSRIRIPFFAGLFSPPAPSVTVATAAAVEEVLPTGTLVHTQRPAKPRDMT